MISSSFLYRSFGLVLALLLFLVGLSGYNFRELLQTSEWRVHTYQTLLETERLLQSLVNTETGTRGFLNSGQEEFLEPYNSGLKNFPSSLQNALVLMKEQPTQVERLERLRTLQEEWVTNYLEPAIDARRAAFTSDEVRTVIETGVDERKIKLDEMRALVQEIEQVERDQLAQRTEQAKQRQAIAQVVLTVGGIFSLLVSTFLAIFAINAFKQLDAANSRLTHSNSRLEEINNRLATTNSSLEAEIDKRRSAEGKLVEALDDLKRSNADLEQFAYVASHDLQEPLRAVAGCVQVLKRRYGGQIDARADQFIDHAVEGAQRMQNLIQDLLAYSRVGTRGKPFAPVNMEAVVDTILRSLSVAIAESKVNITRDPLPEIIADAGQIELVVQNLVSNAIKFRGDKTPQVHIGYKQQSTNEHEEHVFSIRDNGPGIESQYFERIFIMFQRLHTRSEYAGTGIGLAICKKIVERHGGRIWVESTPGEGSVFSFAIPVAPEIKAVAAETPEVATTTTD